MSQDQDQLNHATWECKYHVVFMPKYRKKLLFGLKSNALVRLFFGSRPGVGTVVALAYIAGVEAPARLSRSSVVGAYYGGIDINTCT